MKEFKDAKVLDMLPPHLLAAMRHEGRVYLGCCIVQSPRSWTRMGPTWRLGHGLGTITCGPGVAAWNATEGLAQLAVSTDPKPQWHSVGAAISEEQTLIFGVMDHVIDHHNFRSLCDSAEQLEKELS